MGDIDSIMTLRVLQSPPRSLSVMQVSPYDPQHQVHAWDCERPRWSPGRKRFLQLVVVIAGVIAVTIVAALIVASFQMLRSDDAKLLKQAARDKTRAVALSAATRAECDRLVSEARAAAQPMPPCAARLDGGKQSDASNTSTADEAIAAGMEVAKSALLAAAGD
jgi:hypothetical protein